MNTEPLPAFSAPKQEVIEKWRKSGQFDKQDIFILILAMLVVLLVVLAGIEVFGADPLQAPQRGHGMMRQDPEQRLAWLSKNLNLTDNQKAKITPLLEDEHNQLLKLRQDSSPSPQDRRAKARDIRAKTFEQMRPILTDDQRATLQQMQERMRERIKGRQQGDRPGSGAANE